MKSYEKGAENHGSKVWSAIVQCFIGKNEIRSFFGGYIYIYTYGCESKCKVWIMLRAHMCSRPTIQTPDPDPFRGNDPDVMIQTEMMNNSIDVRTPCGIVQKAISHVQCHTFLYLDVSSTDLKINYKAALHGSR